MESSEQSHLIVNLRNFTHMDSAFLGVLISYLKTLKENDGSILLCEANNETMDVLKIVGMDKLLWNYSTEAEAVSKMKRSGR